MTQCLANYSYQRTSYNDSGLSSITGEIGSIVQLESLIGLLNHACKVVLSGRLLLRRMIDMLHSVHHPPYSKIPIRLNKGDLAWWNMFVRDWNGASFLQPPAHLPQVELHSNASGSWGCGAYSGVEWFQLQWDPTSQHLSIAEKELIPIILACAAWSSSWQNRQVICHCDNQVTVACLQSRISKNPGMMHLLRCLVFVEACYCYHLQPLSGKAIAKYIVERGSQPGPFFLNLNKTAVTKSQFVLLIQSILQLIGLPQFDYAGHSFRIGAATTAVSLGIEDSMIQTLGRWHSAAFLQYIRTPKEQLAAISGVLAMSVPH